MTAPELKAELQTLIDGLDEFKADMPLDRCSAIAECLEAIPSGRLAVALGVPADPVVTGLKRIAKIFRAMEMRQLDGTVGNVRDRAVSLQGHPAELWVLARLFS